MPKKNPLVSVGIVTWNGGNSFKKCLKKVLEHDYSPMEIIVVDNASIDGSTKGIDQKKVKLIINDKNRGSAGGYNLCYANARGKYVVLLAHDDFLEKGCIRELVRGMEMDPSLGCAEGECRHLNGVVYNGNVTVIMSNKRAPENQMRKFYPGDPIIVRNGIVDRFTDSDYFFYGEDIFAGWLIHLRGFRCGRILSGKIIHEGSPTVGRQPKFYRYIDERNRWMTYLTCYQKKNIIRYLPLNVFFTLLRLIKGIFNGYFFSYLKAHLWILVHLNVVKKKRNYVQSLRKVPDSEIIKDLEPVGVMEILRMK